MSQCETPFLCVPELSPAQWVLQVVWAWSAPWGPNTGLQNVGVKQNRQLWAWELTCSHKTSLGSPRGCLAVSRDVPTPPKGAARAEPSPAPCPRCLPRWSWAGRAKPAHFNHPQGSSLHGALRAGVLLQHNFKVVRDKAFNVFAWVYANVLKWMQIAIYWFF